MHETGLANQFDGLSWKADVLQSVVVRQTTDGREGPWVSVKPCLEKLHQILMAAHADQWEIAGDFYHFDALVQLLKAKVSTGQQRQPSTDENGVKRSMGMETTRTWHFGWSSRVKAGAANL